MLLLPSVPSLLLSGRCCIRRPMSASMSNNFGSINALTLRTNDMAASCDFYGGALGLVKTFSSPVFATYSAEAPVTELNNRLHINLELDMKWEAPPPPSTSPASSPLPLPSTRRWGRAVIFVDDVDLIHERLVGAGIRIAKPPMDAPWGERYFHVIDPNGHELSFAKPDYTHPRWSGTFGD